MPNQKRPSTTAQADRVDYLMSVLCVLTILDILTLPLTAIVGIFWVKQYELPMMGEGFSTKINGKKLGQLALLLLSGAALGAFALSATQGLAVVLEQRLPGTLFVMGAGHALWQDLLVAVVTAFVMELAFRRCLFFEWSRYGILPAIIGSGLITMLLTPLPQWPGHCGRITSDCWIKDSRKCWKASAKVCLLLSPAMGLPSRRWMPSAQKAFCI